MIQHRFYFNNRWDSDAVEIFGYALNSDYKGYYLTAENGCLVYHPKEEAEIAKEPLLVLRGLDTKQILTALVEGLKRAGYVAEVDNAQRITSEAVSKERKDEIDWLRKQIENQLEKNK